MVIDQIGVIGGILALRVPRAVTRLTVYRPWLHNKRGIWVFHGKNGSVTIWFLRGRKSKFLKIWLFKSSLSNPKLKNIYRNLVWQSMGSSGGQDAKNLMTLKPSYRDRLGKMLLFWLSWEVFSHKIEWNRLSLGYLESYSWCIFSLTKYGPR